jgi:hypothetical protein
MTHYFEDMGHADCSICEEAKSMLPHSAVPRSNVPCPSCASKDAELKRLREELDNAKFVEEQVRHANDGFAEENKRLREVASAAYAFNDAMRGDYIDAKPEERVTCIVKMSSLGAFVTALDAAKEG